MESLADNYAVHHAIIEVENSCLELAKTNGLIADYYKTNCGDDLNPSLRHRCGEDG